MLFIVIHHCIVSGLGLNETLNDGGENFSSATICLIIMNAFVIVSVNVFFLISGYFGIKLRTQKIKKLLEEVLFYSVAIYAVCRLLGAEKLTLKNILKYTIFSINNYWFVIVYLALMRNIIYIISSKEYLEATMSLQMLSVAMVFALLASIFGLGVLLPNNKENTFLMVTIVSAAVNIVLNFILIPMFKQNAAAFTTALSQAVAFGICWHSSKKYVDMKQTIKSSMQVLIGCLGIVVACVGVKSIELGIVTETFLTVAISVIIYILIEIVLKNSTLYETWDSVYGAVKKKFKTLKLK